MDMPVFLMYEFVISVHVIIEVCVIFRCYNPTRDDTHMTSMKIVQFSGIPTPLVHLCPKSFYPLDVGRLISNEPPRPPLPSDNQSNEKKHNPRMTIICYQVLPSGQLSF